MARRPSRFRLSMMERLGSSRCLRLASTSSTIKSASSAPRQAALTMARSSRLRGAKMPGVSTKIICALSSATIPSTRRRVVCALGETMEIFAPITRLSSVDLPVLGAPIKATKPQRSPSATALTPQAAQQKARGIGFRRPPGAAAALRRIVARQADFHVEDGIMGRPFTSDQTIGGQGQTLSLRPFLQRGFCILGRLYLLGQQRQPLALDETARGI